LHPPFLARPLEQKKEKRQAEKPSEVLQESLKKAGFEQHTNQFWERRELPVVDMMYRPALTTAGNIAGLAYTTTPATQSQSYNALMIAQQQNQ
jgi:hypothetical protein